MVRVRSLLTWGLASTVLAVGVVTAVPGGAAAAPSTQASAAEPTCSAFDDPIYQRNKPKNDASLVTPSAKEASGASAYGFTEDKGTVFLASTRPAAGLVEVHRLYRWQGQDFVASANPDEWEQATENNYTDQGVSFYASPVAADCLVPVYRLQKGGKNRLAAAGDERSALIADGWGLEGISFYAKPAAGSEPEPDPTPTPTDPPAGTDTKFSFAIYPDTQQEVGKDSRFINRSQWLVDNKSSLDLRFVSHTGDVVNWDTPDHEQYEVASKAMVPLEKSNIPYSLAIGNHDTQATGPGGGARDSKRTRELQRDTSTFNDYFNAERYGDVSGAFEKNKVDNVYSLYEAGGVKWMVVALELWPRESVVSWLKSSIASHPDYNVVVVTHDYLDGGGGIEQSAGYGDVSPQELYDQVISQYANVRMVFSGHVGYARTRVDTGKNGNKIYSYLTAIHSNTTNPVRMVEVDTEADTIKSWVYAPYTKQTLVEPETLDDVRWVNP